MIDNLLDRARPLLAQAPFTQARRHTQPTFALIGAIVADRAAAFGELRAAARAARSVPQQCTTPRERAPAVYNAAALAQLLRVIAENLPVAFTVGELDHVLRLVLPHLLPGVLDLDEFRSTHTGDPDEAPHPAEVRRAGNELLDRLDGPRRVALTMKIAGASDARVARLLGVSRRTATNRKADAYQAVEDVLASLSPAARTAVLVHVQPALQASLAQVRSRWPVFPHRGA